MQKIIVSFRVFVTWLIVLGILYPLLVTGIGQMLMPFEANGSLLEKDDQIIGSELIGQQFLATKYFHSRPSAVAYDASNSGANNFAPSSPQLIALAKTRLNQIYLENNLTAATAIPADMVLASASGLDPNISLENAKLQAPRIAHIRNLPLSKITKLIYANLDPDFVGIWGRSGVNVLKLNLMLDEIDTK